MSKFLFSFLFLFVFSAVAAVAQNLVPNGGFETSTSCPDNYSQVNKATGWFAPTEGTPDYFHTCATGFLGPRVSVPNNGLGTQLPHSGNAYAGIITYASLGLNFQLGLVDTVTREYIQIILSQPLVVGQTYKVEFYVSLGEGENGNGQINIATDDISACFTVNQLTFFSGTWNGIGTTLRAHPQVNNPEGNFITSTSEWTKISGCFVADSAYKFFTIGCFKSADVSRMYVNTTWTTGDMSYYYIDDVSVEPVPNMTDIIAGDPVICNGAPALLNITGGTSPLWSTGETTNAIGAVTAGEVSVAVTSNGCVYHDTVLVNDIILQPDAGEDISICDAEAVTLSSVSPDPLTEYLWSTGETTASITVTEPGNYWIQHFIESCTATDEISVEMNFTPDVQSAEFILCENETVTLHSGLDENIHTFLWSTGETSPAITVDHTGIFSLTATNDCGSDTDVMEVIDGGDCICAVYIPNSFTPTGNGLNEMFGPVSVCSFREFDFSIYNRWGQLVFSSEDPGTQWTATDCKEDIYTWKLRFIPAAPMVQKEEEMTGRVMVVR